MLRRRASSNAALESLPLFRAPGAVRLWKARSSSRDFRDADFDATSIVAQDDAAYQTSVPRPDQGYRAALGEAVYAIQDQTFTPSTQVQIPASEEADASTRPY